jgi:hypothetical protein
MMSASANFADLIAVVVATFTIALIDGLILFINFRWLDRTSTGLIFLLLINLLNSDAERLVIDESASDILYFIGLKLVEVLNVFT